MIILFVLADEEQEQEKPKIKITANDECILKNQVRKENKLFTYILSTVL